MKRIAIAGLSMALLAGATRLEAQEAPATPGPEQAWLERLAGEWETQSEAILDPAQPPVESTGTESVRMLGDSWVVSEIQSSFMDVPFSAVLTLGYDPEKEKFVGTWIDSLSSYLWHYEGTLDAEGTTLTLETEGPCIRTPGRHARYREVMTLESRDEKTFTSRALIDGQWEPVVTIRSRRKR